MFKNYKKYILIIIGIILLFLFYSVIFYTNFSFFPEKYSKIELLFSIFNIIFGFGVLFGIYQWKIDRYNKLRDDFLDRCIFLLDKILDFNKKDNYFIEQIRINSFKNIEFIDGKLYIDILGKDFDIKILDNKNIEYSNVFEFINFFLLNKNYVYGDIKKFIFLKITIIGNLNYYYYIWLILHIYKNIEYNYTNGDNYIVLKNKKDIDNIQMYIDNLKDFNKILN